MRPADSYELAPARGHVLEPEPEPELVLVLLPAPAPAPELAPASLQRPECCTWAADRVVDKRTTGLLRSETTLVEGLHCGVAAAEPVAARGDEDEEN